MAILSYAILSKEGEELIPFNRPKTLDFSQVLFIYLFIYLLIYLFIYLFFTVVSLIILLRSSKSFPV